MNVSIVTAVCLILMLIRPSLNESPNDIDDGLDDYEEEDYNSADYDYLFDHNKTEIIPLIIKTTTTTTTQQPTTSTTDTSKRIPKVMITNQDAIPTPNVYLELFPQKSYTCPEPCTCSAQFTQVNCSSRNLKNVPSNLPEILEKLDLSHNELVELKHGDFVSYSNLIELILDNNRLTVIDFKDISGLGKLKHLSLVDNQISQIDPNAFSRLSQLRTLNLSQNLIAIGDGKMSNGSSSFLNHPGLEELNLSSCKVQAINAETFRGLSSLATLNLDGNDFNEIDAHVFDSMKNLVKLKLPNMERATITELCKVLTAIDTISFPHFDISCFELVSGSTFEESMIRTSELTSDVNGIYDTVNGKNSNPSEGNLKSYASKDDSQGTVGKNGEKSIKSEHDGKKKQSSAVMKESGTSSSNSSTTPAINQQQADSDDEEEYKVAISTQTINHILIGIIIVAVTGIIIGIICRRDICGIKTKMCRTRRPPPTDQVRPAEEIPLNKV